MIQISTETRELCDCDDNAKPKPPNLHSNVQHLESNNDCIMVYLSPNLGDFCAVTLRNKIF